MTILEADSVQTIRSLEHFIATNCNRALNNTLRLGEQSVEPLSDAHVKFLSLTTALQHEQAKNEVLTVCNARSCSRRACRRARQPVQLKVNVAAGASLSNCLGKRKRDDDDVREPREPREGPGACALGPRAVMYRPRLCHKLVVYVQLRSSNNWADGGSHGREPSMLLPVLPTGG